MLDSVTTSEGLAVVHLFCARTAATENDAVVSAVKAAEAADVQVVTAAILGHKAELCFMALAADGWALRDQNTNDQWAPGPEFLLDYRFNYGGTRTRKATAIDPVGNIVDEFETTIEVY